MEVGPRRDEDGDFDEVPADGLGEG
ncbi:MAG: hypothetical protein METHAR1v1_1230010, partial [Methanothrix sp.]